MRITWRLSEGTDPVEVRAAANETFRRFVSLVAREQFKEDLKQGLVYNSAEDDLSELRGEISDEKRSP